MLTEAMVVFIISNFCGVKDPKITKTEKMECIEFLTNCAIGPGGVSTNKLMDSCRDEWVDIERRNKRVQSWR